MKVLLISHTCMSRTAGQPKLDCLAKHKDVELTALVPDRMCSYDKWSAAERPENAAYRFEVGKTTWHYIKRQWYLMRYADTLKPLIRELQPDVVDIWEEPWGLMAAQGVYWTRKLAPKAKIIVETEQNIYKDLPPPFAWFQKYCLRRSDFMVARNQEAAEVLRRKGYGGPVRVVPNAADCDLFHPMEEEERARERSAAGFGGAESFVVGYVGRLVAEKGLAEAVSAAAELPEDVRLAFIGEGPMREELEAQAARLGISGRVIFTGAKPLTQLPGIMNSLDVLILPSRTTASWKEQFGRVLIEAGACRTAVVGSDSGAIPEVVGDAGLIFPEGDAAALARCLLRLRDDPAFRRRCGEIGRERAVCKYSWQCVADQMRVIYQEVLGAG